MFAAVVVMMQTYTFDATLTQGRQYLAMDWFRLLCVLRRLGELGGRWCRGTEKVINGQFLMASKHVQCRLDLFDWKRQHLRDSRCLGGLTSKPFHSCGYFFAVFFLRIFQVAGRTAGKGNSTT